MTMLMGVGVVDLQYDLLDLLHLKNLVIHELSRHQ